LPSVLALSFSIGVGVELEKFLKELTDLIRSTINFSDNPYMSWLLVV
jgi:hypothetical protein